ncbi:Tetratricopeptide repeat protein [anaerobic digester metagenome]
MKLNQIFFFGFLIFVFASNGVCQTVNETKNAKQQTTDSVPALSSKDKLSLEIQTYEGLVQTMQQETAGEQALAPLLTRLGNLYFSTQDYPKAINAYIRAIIIREFDKTGTGFRTADLGWHLIEIGNSLYRLQDFDLAEYPYNIALTAFSSIDGPEGIEGMITASNNIALCKLNAGNPEGALPVFVATLKMSQKYGETQRIYITQVYIGTCYLEMQQYDKCIALLKSPSLIALAESESPLNMFRLETLGDAYYRSGKIDSAISVYNTITSVSAVIELADNIAEASIKLSRHYLKVNDVDKALTCALKAEKSLTNISNSALQMSADEILYGIYKSRGDYREALRYYESYSNLQKQLNSQQLESFIDDYNKKAERIATSLEMAQIDAQRKKAEAEKANQKTLSFFMIVITALLLVMLFTGKGFEPRIQLLEEFISEMKLSNKLITLIVLLVYFLAFFYFFIPVEHAVEIRHFGFIPRLLPGLLAFLVFFVVTAGFYSIQAKKQAEERNYRYYLILFGALYLTVFLCEAILFAFFGFTSVNFLLSLFLIVLASYIVPFYLVLMAVERLIIKRFETMSASLTQDISQIKQNVVPTTEVITVESEKTSGKLSFIMDDFIAVEAQGNYCMFYLMRKNVVTRKLLHTTMKALEAQLSAFPQVIRCHKSFLINIHQISRVSGNSRGYSLHFTGDMDSIPVSRGYQKDVMQIIQQFREEIS